MLAEGGMSLELGPEGARAQIRAIGPWGALTAVSATAAYAALNIAALNAGTATGVAFFLSTSAVPLMIGGAFIWAAIKAKLKMSSWMKMYLINLAKKKIRSKLHKIVFAIVIVKLWPRLI